MRHVIVSLVVCAFSLLGGCHKPYAERIKHMEPDEFNSSMLRGLRELDISSLPVLMDRMKEAPGDMLWPYRNVSRTRMPPRFVLQWAIKQILRRDYVRRNPEYEGVSWLEVDDSIGLAHWWETAETKIEGGKPYELPGFMIPFKFVDDIKEVTGSERVHKIEAAGEEQRRRFEQKGYRTIEEMMSHGG
ncbi:unnamed protein product [marine sediment metagenome]|uniref:Lipoprotein n=1 Tax=marine sediment metagenome TaxID=412755 RepID=X1GTI9_9ZZZZ